MAFYLEPVVNIKLGIKEALTIVFILIKKYIKMKWLYRMEK